MSDPLRRYALLAAILLLAGLAVAGILWSRMRLALPETSASLESTDPRRTYDGPYRNIHPDIRYVGDAQCAGCHEDIAHSFAQHPMGRSLFPVASFFDQQGALPREAWERGGRSHNPFRIFDRHFEIDRKEKRMWHNQFVLDGSGKPAVELPLEAQWVIGSGAKGYSFMFERDGYLFQTPISWFTQQQRWDLSPGFGPMVVTGRLVGSSCLFCHANSLQEHPQHPNRFVSATGETPNEPLHLHSIGCERCHGPGQLHVNSADRWDIVNPARLPPQLRDSVCEQCHLEGEARIVRASRKLFDFRPGLPLNDFWAVMVQGKHNDEDTKAVNHVEQMYQSKCFSRPVGDVKLGCITCHDPHVRIGPAQRQAYYRPKCLVCHDGAKDAPVCSEPLPRRKQLSPQDSCIDCHMPRYRSWDVAHTATTDHRILRRATPPKDGSGAASPDQPNLENVPLVDFYRDRFPGGDSQTERSMGLGVLRLIRMNMLPPQRHADRALRFLEAALGRDPADDVVRQGKVEAYLLMERSDRALSEAEELVPRQPGNWQLLIQAAYAAEGSGQKDRALDYWRQVSELNPFMVEARVHLLKLLLTAKQSDVAQKQCEELLRLDPFNITGRQARVGLLLQQGKPDEARRAFEMVRKLKPPDLAQREAWFRQQLR